MYPTRFRARYGDAALELFRDRARDERGFFRRLRLWLDLITDFARSLPRQYGRMPPDLRPAAMAEGSADVPSFHLLEEGLPRVDALFVGAVLTVAALSTSQLLDHGSRNLPAAFVEWSVQGRAVQREKGMSSPVGRGVAGEFRLDSAGRRRIIQAAAENLKKDYLEPAAGQKMADALAAHEKAGEYDAVTEGAAFAGLLTKQLQETSDDPHVDVVYSGSPLPERPPGTTPEGQARYRKAMEQENCTFRSVEIRAHNVGYFKLDAFPDAAVCQDKATAAMAKLNGADALIFDLRDNRGGYPNMVALIFAYLFDHPEYLYHPGEKTTERSWTRSPVEGNRLADKPVYVLTSGRTASGAEQFSYNVKMLKRGVLVGETTRGVAHAAVFRRIDGHFGMGIPEQRGINPYGKRDWEGIGVEPDVKVAEDEALGTAEKLARNRLVKRR